MIRASAPIRVATVLGCALALLVVAVSAAQGAPRSSKLPHLVIGYSDPNAASPLLSSVGLGMQQAISLLHLPWSVRDFNAGLSSNQQVSDMDTMISLHLGGIATWTLNQGAAESAYARVAAAKIPLIGINSNSPSFASEVGAYTDTTCLVAKAQAQYIAKRIPHAKLFVISGPPVPSVAYTSNCFYTWAAKLGLSTVQTQAEPSGQQAAGQDVVASALLSHPDIQAIWSWSEADALGAGVALQNAHKTVWSGSHQGIVLVTRGGSPAAAAEVKAGLITADWDNNQPLVGAAAIQVLKYLLVDHVPLSKIPKFFAIKSHLWDASTIKSYVDPTSRQIKLPLPVSLKTKKK